MQATNIGKNRNIWVFLAASIIIPVLLCGAVVGFTVWGNSAGSNVLSQNLAEPLGSSTAAKFDINTGTGTLTIDRLSNGEQLLASGTLQYLKSQGMPTWSVKTSDGQVNFTLKARDGRQAGIRLPWAVCNGETEWQIHLNPILLSDITAHSGGGNGTVESGAGDVSVITQ